FVARVAVKEVAFIVATEFGGQRSNDWLADLPSRSLYAVLYVYLTLDDLFFGEAKKAQYGVSLGCHLRAVAYLRTTTAKWGQESHVVR
ncbi:hypothetical protein E2986_13108, partial [Frieseomelitta varia]